MKLNTLVFLLLILILSGCKGFNIFPHEYSHPSDSDLEKIFDEKKDSFNKLIALFLEDSENNANSYWIGRENFILEQLPKHRKTLYQELFNSLRILSIGRDYDNSKIIRLLVFSGSKGLEGNEIQVDIKGYLYSPENISKGKINFGETDNWGDGYKEIDENWYIFHETMSGKPE